MITCASSSKGAVCLFPRRHPAPSRGFTLLEICMVMFIIILLLAASVPAIESAFVEQATRGDSHQLALMVKTAMLRSTEQHRSYILDLTDATLSLHPADPAPSPAPGTSTGGTDSSDSSGSDSDPASSSVDDVIINSDLNSGNKLLLPDPDKPGAWIPLKNGQWIFQPGEFCPAPTIRVSRGDSWVELTFNPLTGDVDAEKSYFP